MFSVMNSPSAARDIAFAGNEMCPHRQMKTPPNRSPWAPKSHSSKDKVKTQSSRSSSGVGSSRSELFPVNYEVVRIASVTTPQDFTVHYVNKAQKYEEFRKELQSKAERQPQLVQMATNGFCLAFHSYDRMWCRAVIVDVEEDEDFMVTLKCVDDGTTFSITERNELKSSSGEIMGELFYGTNCSLPILINSKRETEATQHLIRMMNFNLKCFVIENINGLRYVELYHDGQNTTDFFVDIGIGRRMFVAPSECGFVNYIDSPENFSIQMDRDTEALERIVEFTKKYALRPITSPKVGMLVIARFSIDKNWYRAKIVSKELKGFNVYLIDHGHSTFVDEIGEIGDQAIAAIHPIAIKCSLILPAAYESFEDDAKDEFVKIADGGKKKFDVKMIAPGEKHAKVELYIEGVNILDKLLPCSTCKTHSKVASDFDDDEGNF